MSNTALKLGPFELHRRVGLGGMGEVWRGVHAAQGVPVAVKILNLPRVNPDRFLRDFQGEVRAMAGLSHPAIVQIYDYGRLPPGGLGALSAGRPFLVMEWVEGGTLRAPMIGAPWSRVRALLLTLLDALAHAHARGLIHRDLKPENVLWGGGVEAVKLTDFGLAQAIEHDVGNRTTAGTVQGTPSYMAPEQIQGHIRDFGPWTDLYALGCMAYEYVCGRTPYVGDTPVDTMVAHLTAPTPLWLPVIDVPEGLEAWVRTLMQRSPTARFRRAADARWALCQLGEADVMAELTPPVGFAPVEPLATAPTIDVPSAELAQTQISAPQPVAPVPIADAPAADTPRPPVPMDWRHAMVEVPGQTPLGVGVTLYPLRALPVIGRIEERAALWGALTEVIERQRPAMILLDGPAGYGKSRLAEWLCEAGHYSGAATPLRAIHGPLRGRAHGLGTMVARYARLQGLRPHEGITRLEAMCRDMGITDHMLWMILGAMIYPGEAAAQGVKISSPQELWAVMTRWITTLAQDRPVVIWLDDVQWGVDALSWAEHLLDRRAEITAPVLLVATARTEALSERPQARSRLDMLTERPDVTRITVGPLPAADRQALLTALLGLEPPLIGALDARTEGNPLFAAQLIGDWARRGLLVPGPEGYRLRPGADVAIPEDVRGLWAARVDRLLADHPAGDQVALMMAAALGRTVDTAEWQSALAWLDITPSPELVEHVLEEGLAQREEGGGWSFVHGMLRESLEAQSRRQGLQPALHRACAEMLAARIPADRNLRGREGTHWLRAQVWDRAMIALADSVRRHLETGAYPEAQRLLDAWFVAAEGGRIPEGDPRWAEGWALRSDLLRMIGQLEEARPWAERIEAHIEWPTWASQRGPLLLVLGALAKDRGDLPQAERWLRQALAIPSPPSKIREELAWVLLGQGRTEEAGAQFKDALDHLRAEAGEDQGAGRCMVGLSRVAKRRNDYDEALTWLGQAEACFVEAGFRAGEAACLNQRGELARLLGRMDEAEQCYRQAWARYEAVGSGNGVFPQANLALVLIERGAQSEARPLLEAALRRFSEQGRVQYAGALRICLLPCLIGDPRAFDLHLSAAEAILEETALADVDAARMASLAGRDALGQGDRPRGLRALGIAKAQWARLERPDQVAIVEAEMAR